MSTGVRAAVSCGSGRSALSEAPTPRAARRKEAITRLGPAIPRALAPARPALRASPIATGLRHVLMLASALGAAALATACGRAASDVVTDAPERTPARASLASAHASASAQATTPSVDEVVLHAGVADPAEPVVSALVAAPTACVPKPRTPHVPVYIPPTVSPRPMGGDMMMVVPTHP